MVQGYDVDLVRNSLAECPRCGCNDCEILKQPGRGGWFGEHGFAACRHCGSRFHITPKGPAATTTTPPVTAHVPQINGERQERPPNTYDPSICPECGGKSRVYTSRGRTQYRKCKQCEHRFKTTKPET